MTFQISWRVAWQLRQPVPSGLWDASRQVPWTSVHLGSAGGPECLQEQVLFKEAFLPAVLNESQISLVLKGGDSVGASSAGFTVSSE